jgi:ABC-2 type transport system ATP-binding protein
VIRTEALTKRFPGRGRPVTAVEGLDLEVAPGEVLGLLGPNGAGKTTTVRLLTALVAPSSGRAWVNGTDVARDPAAVRRSVGLLTEVPGLYERLSAEATLTFYARLYGVARVAAQVEKYLRLTGLWERRSEPVGRLSKGMRQKLAIARALVHEPSTIFLDEPTAALDPEAARAVRGFLAELRTAGRTIVLCTHDLDEADRLCDRVAVLRTRLIGADTPANLRRALFGRQVAVRLGNPDERWAALARALPFVRHASLADGRLLLAVDDPERHNPALIRHLCEAGAEVRFVEEVAHSLEDVYLALVRREPGPRPR